eukprot:Amastigsp_a510961_115.p6 type:complete len:137 gc:universal Amastigsp_a510961_115:2680-3090(+)
MVGLVDKARDAEKRVVLSLLANLGDNGRRDGAQSHDVVRHRAREVFYKKNVERDWAGSDRHANLERDPEASERAHKLRRDERRVGALAQDRRLRVQELADTGAQRRVGHGHAAGNAGCEAPAAIRRLRDAITATGV